MKILVTGGAGFIGSHLVDALIKKGHNVVVIDNLSTGKRKNLNQDATFYNTDISSRDEIFKILSKEKPEIIYHCAAQIDVRKSVEDPVFDAHVNILGSLNIFESVKKSGIEKIIFSSTGGAIYGNTTVIPSHEELKPEPISPYGIAKLVVEKYLYYYYKIFHIPYIILRYANVYGPRQNNEGEAGVISIFCDKILNNQIPKIFGDGSQTRDFVYIDDVVSANLLALEANKVGIYNVGTGRETDVNQIAELLKKVSKTKKEFMHIAPKSGELPRSSLDSKKIQRELGWKPTIGIQQGIKKTWSYFKHEYEKQK